MYPEDVPDPIADQSYQTSLDNSSDALKKVQTDLAGKKKCGVKTGSNIKYDKTREYWYLDFEVYQ